MQCPKCGPYLVGDGVADDGSYLAYCQKCGWKPPKMIPPDLCQHPYYLVLSTRNDVVLRAWCPSCGATYGKLWGHGPKWWLVGSINFDDEEPERKKLPSIEDGSAPECKCQGCVSSKRKEASRQTLWEKLQKGDRVIVLKGPKVDTIDRYNPPIPGAAVVDLKMEGGDEMLGVLMVPEFLPEPLRQRGKMLGRPLTVGQIVHVSCVQPVPPFFEVAYPDLGLYWTHEGIREMESADVCKEPEA